MAQHDYNIANQSGADFRADLNNALLAIATVNSGSTEPSTTFAHQLWVDTSSSVLKIRNSADNAWITTGVSITASNTFTGDLTGNVTGNLTGNVTGNVTGDLTGNADSADILTTARTISLSGDVVGSVSFDGSTNVDIDTVVQINSITLGTDTTGDYVESMSGGTGVTVTGGTGEGSTPSIAIGQSVATTDNVTFNLVTATDEFVGDIDGAVRFSAKADEALTKGDVIYITGVSGNTPTIAKAKADDASKMPAFGIAAEDANANTNLQIVTLGTIKSLDTSNESVGEILYVSTTAGEYTTTIPTGESSQVQNIGKVLRSHAVNGSIRVGGAGRSNATPNLNNGNIFIGNASNQSVTATLDTSIVVENTNLYYTTTRANTDFDIRLATKDTDSLSEGSNLYYTTARANTDFDTRLATKSTTDLAEGTNLYYTTARFDSAFTSKDTDDLSEGTTNLYYTTTRFDSAFNNKTTSDLTEGTNLYYTDTRANSAIDARVTKAFVDALGIQATSVAANSVTLGTDTVGNYVATVTGTANKITVSGSGSESANITLSLPDDVQIADSLTVAGNLTVNGTLTSLDTTNLDIEDNLFQLNAGLTGSPVNDSGMLINRGTADNSIFMWDESVDKFTLGLTTADGSATGNITLNSLGTLVANIEGNVTGNVTGTVSSISNHSTSDLSEGTNLYYTQARFDSALAAKSTSDLSEGSNLYYTDARFDTRLASKDTDDVSEGTTNLYYTTARFDSAFGGKSTSDLSEGTNLYYTSARANSDFDTRLALKDTGDLAEGSNLYYTDARVQAVSINNVVEDTTPQLGGDLDLNSSDITGTGNINITGTIQSSGNITGTLATAAQPNITSLGTLTALTGGTGDLNWDSGTLFVDSSANRVGIGTTSVGTKLNIRSDASDDGILLEKSDGTDIARLFHDGTSTNARFDMFSGGSATVQIKASGDTHFSGGNVGIGNSSPTDKLHIGTNSGGTQLKIQSASSINNCILHTNGTTDSWRTGMNLTLTNGSYEFYDDVNNVSRMVLDSSGNVAIGHTTTTGSKFAICDGANSQIQFFPEISTDTNLTQHYDPTAAVYINSETRAASHAWKIGTSDSMTIDSAGSTTFTTGTNDGVKITGAENSAYIDSSKITDVATKGTFIGIKRPEDGNVTVHGIGTYDTASNAKNNLAITSRSDIVFASNNGEMGRFDSSGRLLVATTSTAPHLFTSGRGFAINQGTFGIDAACDNIVGIFNRTDADGTIVEFKKDGAVVGGIGANGGMLTVGGGDCGVYFEAGTTNVWFPYNPSTSSTSDNAISLGWSSARFTQVYAVNGTIQTSDRNEKQDIEALTDAETRVAVAAKGLLRKFKWKSAVASKGDEARIHFGIIAQDLQDAFIAEGLDASDYAMFCSDTWWEAEEVIPAVEEELDEDGNVVTEAQEEKIVTNTYDSEEEAPENAIEETRLGVRYSELLAFIIASL